MFDRIGEKIYGIGLFTVISSNSPIGQTNAPSVAEFFIKLVEKLSSIEVFTLHFFTHNFVDVWNSLYQPLQNFFIY